MHMYKVYNYTPHSYRQLLGNLVSRCPPAGRVSLTWDCGVAGRSTRVYKKEKPSRQAVRQRWHRSQRTQCVQIGASDRHRGAQWVQWVQISQTLRRQLHMGIAHTTGPASTHRTIIFPATGLQPRSAQG